MHELDVTHSTPVRVLLLLLNSASARFLDVLTPFLDALAFLEEPVVIENQ